MMERQIYKHIIKNEALWKIESFYLHVALKYRHTYSFEDMDRNVLEAISNAHLIEKSLLRRKPTLERWKNEGWHMANAGNWYYAYTITDDTIIIEDACHEQNMHEENPLNS